MSFLIDTCWREVRYGLRQLRRSPAFTLVAVSALSIGVGANITVFSFVSTWLFRPLDAREPARLVRITGPGGDGFAANSLEDPAYILPKDYLEYRDRNQTFSAIAAGHIVGGPMRVRIDGPTQMIVVTPVTGNYFEMLGVPAALGRTLSSADGRRGAREVIVLTDAGWRRFFDAKPDVIGTTVVLDGVIHTVVGVLPEWFTGTHAPTVPQIYRPIIEEAGALAFPFRLHLIGRLLPGVSPAQAQADLTRIATQLSAADREQRSIEIYPARNVIPFMRRALAVLGLIFSLIVGVVLLIACDNIAILTTIRSAMRHREIGIRLALGASRSRLLLQLATESALLCAISGLVGMYIAYSTAKVATRFYLPVPVPFALTFKPDWRVVAFAIAVSCMAMLVCGLMPAMKWLKTDLMSTFKGSGLTNRLRSGLIVTQMTLSTALLVIAVVLANSLFRTITDDRRFVGDRVVMSTVAIGGDDYTAERRVRLLGDLLERIERAPGVSAAAIVESVPLTNNVPLKVVQLRSGDRLEQVYVNGVSRGVFRTLAIPLLAGRDFVAADDLSPTSVGIVNETLTQRLWPGENPIGKLLQGPDGSGIQVVGLARDSKYESMEERPKAVLYRPITLNAGPTPTVLIKPAGDPSTVLTLVRSQLADLDPNLAAYNVMTLDDRLNLGLMVNRAGAIVSASMGLLALALGVIGIYGSMAFLVHQRQREIAVRLALGASRAHVTTLITNQGLIWAGSGLALGVVLGELASFGLSRVVRGVAAIDLLALLLTPLGLGVAAYLASYLPARRAARLDPLAAMREE